MVRKVTLFIAILGLLSPLALAQYDEYKLEITPYLGYTFSEGVDISATDIGDGNIVNRLSPTSGSSYGFIADYLVGEHFAVGFNFSQQNSNLEGRLQGSGKQNFADMKVRNYHGVFTYNMGDEDAPMRPYFFGGLGATQYAPGQIEGNDSSGGTRFSTTWGGGVKFFVSEHVGIRGQGRWTPTYIKSDPGGI
ncbi:MAG: outer membrane beta-barrel protein, partial [bacterium]